MRIRYLMYPVKLTQTSLDEETNRTNDTRKKQTYWIKRTRDAAKDKVFSGILFLESRVAL